jgi:hypothetical protein
LLKPAALIFAAALLSFPSRADADCKTSPAPRSWRSEAEAAPAPVPDGSTALNPLTIVIFRHAEKPMRENGVMMENGQLGAQAVHRLARLPDALLGEFGCPDLLVAPNPAVKMRNKVTGDYFNYVRPLATIIPLAVKIEFPVWTPYGFNQNDFLARDLLADKALAPDATGKAKTVFIAWERNNIRKIYDQLAAVGRLASREGTTITVDGAAYTCESPAKWRQCDFDSIWLIHVAGGGICLTPRHENLNDADFQNRCKGAESTTDQP